MNHLRTATQIHTSLYCRERDISIPNSQLRTRSLSKLPNSSVVSHDQLHLQFTAKPTPASTIRALETTSLRCNRHLHNTIRTRFPVSLCCKHHTQSIRSHHDRNSLSSLSLTSKRFRTLHAPYYYTRSQSPSPSHSDHRSHHRNVQRPHPPHTN